MKIKHLVEQIKSVNTALYEQASKAVNCSLTLRNWLIGYYLVEYEQQGEDRAAYDTKILEKLSAELTAVQLKGMSVANLSRYRQFFMTYPQLGQSVIRVIIPV